MAFQSPRLRRLTWQWRTGYDARISVLSVDQPALRMSSSALGAACQYNLFQRDEKHTRADLSSPASSPSSNAHAFCTVSSRISQMNVKGDIRIDRLKTCTRISNTFLLISLDRKKILETHAWPSFPFVRSARGRMIRQNG